MTSRDEHMSTHGCISAESTKELADRCRQAERVAREYEKALRFYAENCDVMYSPEPGAPPLEDAWYVAREALRLHGLARREET